MDVSDIIKSGLPPSPGILDSVAGIYGGFGINTPILRFGSTALLSYGLIHVIKPAIWYHENGEKKPWSVLSDADDAVLLSPEIISIVLGVLAAGV